MNILPRPSARRTLLAQSRPVGLALVGAATVLAAMALASFLLLLVGAALVAGSLTWAARLQRGAYEDLRNWEDEARARASVRRTTYHRALLERVSTSEGVLVLHLSYASSSTEVTSGGQVLETAHRGSGQVSLPYLPLDRVLDSGEWSVLARFLGSKRPLDVTRSSHAQALEVTPLFADLSA